MEIEGREFSILAPANDAPGLGLRREHYEHILAGKEIQAQWFEAITENYMDSLGRPRRILRRVRQDFPVALHGVSLSVASADLFGAQGSRSSADIPDLTQNYLRRWKQLIHEIEPFIVSDHLCWTRTEKLQSHDLLPVSFSRSWLDLICSNVNRIQDYLGRSIALENVSSYVGWKHPEMQEWEFLNHISERTGCGILLDINNVFVNAHNHDFDALTFIQGIRPESVQQYHIAGHEIQPSIRFDTHGTSVSSEVRTLYSRALKCIGARPLLLERDQDIPPFPELERELILLAASNGVSESEGESLEYNSSYPELQVGEPAKRESIQSSLKANADRIGKSIQDPASAQMDFLEAIFSGRLSHSLEEQLMGAGQPAMDSIQSLNVYRESVLSRLMDSLEETFAPLKVFESRWFLWFKDYIEKHPPEHYSLSEYGRELAGMLRSENSVARDLARICFLNVRFFHGQRPGGKWMEDLVSGATRRRKKAGADGYTIRRDVALLSVCQESLEIWKSWKEASKINPESKDTGRVSVLFFHDPEERIRMKELQPEEAGILTQLLKGHSLEQSMQWLGRNFPAVKQQSVFSFFQFLTLAGILVSDGNP